MAIEILGMPEFDAALTGAVDKVNAAASDAVMEGGLLIQREAMVRASGPARWLKSKSFPRSGGPGVVTGTGRRSYHVEGPNRTAAGWMSQTGPSALEMLFTELGTSRGIPKNTYQALVPAVNAVEPMLAGIFEKHWAKALAE